MGRKPQVLFGTYQHDQLAIKHTRDCEAEESQNENDLDLLDPNLLQSWRVRDRMKTVSVALVLCLNIGVDPPGIVKPNPCARLECWIDPLSMQSTRAIDTIGKYLQQQYERWQPRARYKVTPDPTVEEVRKLCTALRRNAKDERVLLHYNGHGVPLPTANGEVWVFNKTYTQYIPLSIYDLQMWMGTPSIYVFDCSEAGLIVSSFKTFAQHREREQREHEQNASSASSNGQYPSDDPAMNPVVSYRECILLAACQATEILPTNPDLPADLFTSCLTTPIKMALRWFAPRSLLGISMDKLDRIPGRLNDRKTPLGELNWIFTAITDTIAWNVLPRDLFKRLFRQDLLVASLFRNFLLAERIMWTVNCKPVSEPKLPSTHNHPLWQAWDYTVEQCLAQLPGMLAAEDAANARAKSANAADSQMNGHLRDDNGSRTRTETAGVAENFQYTPNTFFVDQMTAFEVWLAMGPERDQPPEQLPIVLQVLLSQAHRLRALRLLARFLQIGAWAIDHALSVGIFPYVLKLLQSSAADLRQELVFIWGKVLSLDTSCVLDLVKEKGQAHFVNFLRTADSPPVYVTMAAFILTIIVTEFPDQLPSADVIEACAGVLGHENELVRRWACLCLAQMLKTSPESVQQICVYPDIVSKLSSLAKDDVASDVRTATVSVLSNIVVSRLATSRRRRSAQQNESQEDADTANQTSAGESPQMSEGEWTNSEIVELLQYILSSNSSSLVRREIAVNFCTIAREITTQTSRSLFTDEIRDLERRLSIALAVLETDPHPIVAVHAREAKKALCPQLMLNQPVAERKAETRRAPTDASSSDQPQGDNNPLVTFSGMLEAILGNTGSPPPPEANPLDRENVYRNVPFVAAGADEAAKEAVASMPSTYQIFCRSVLNMRYDGARRLEPYLDEERVGVNFVTARKQIFESDAKSLWTHTETNGFRSKLREVETFDLCGGEIWASSFLPLDPVIVTGDSRGVVSIWNTDSENLIARFGIPRRSAAHISGITSLCLLDNNIESAVIAAGAADGVVAIWTQRNNCKQRIVSSWRASGTADLLSVPNGLQDIYKAHGLMLDWNDERAELYAGGCELGNLKIWNVATELCDSTRSVFDDDLITAINSRVQNTVAAGGKLGTVVAVDVRTAEDKVSFTNNGGKPHRDAVVSVQQQAFGNGTNMLLSASVDGTVAIWDARQPDSPVLFKKLHRGGQLTTMAVHLSVRDLIVTGSSDNEVRIFDYSGHVHKEIRFYEGFLSQRIGPVTSLCLHPRKPALAVGCADSILSVYE